MATCWNRLRVCETDSNAADVTQTLLILLVMIVLLTEAVVNFGSGTVDVFIIGDLVLLLVVIRPTKVWAAVDVPDQSEVGKTEAVGWFGKIWGRKQKIHAGVGAGQEVLLHHQLLLIKLIYGRLTLSRLKEEEGKRGGATWKLNYHNVRWNCV